MSNTSWSASDSNLFSSANLSAFSSGRWSRRSAAGEAFSGASVLAAIFGPELNSPSVSQHAQLTRLVGPHLQEIRSLSGERSSEMFYEGLFRLGQRLEADDRLEAAGAVYQAIAGGQSAAEPELRTRAQRQLDAMNGVNAGGLRAEFLLRRLAKQTLEPASLVGLGVASGLFRVTRLAGLSRLATTPTANLLTRGAGAQVLAGTGAFLVEAAAFPMVTRLGSLALGRELDWSGRQIGKELAGSFLVLGAMKLTGIGASRLTRGARSPVLSGLANQGAMLTGLYLGHRAEGYFHFRPHLDNATTWIDSLAMLAQLNAAARLAHGVLGEDFVRMERTLDAYAEAVGRANGGGARDIRQWLGENFGPRSELLAGTSGAGMGPTAASLRGPRNLIPQNVFMTGDPNQPSGGSGRPTSSLPPAGVSEPPTGLRPPPEDRANLPHTHSSLLVTNEGMSPVHVDIASPQAIPDEAPLQVQSALRNLLNGSEAGASFRLTGPVAELLRTDPLAAEAFRPTADHGRRAWFQIAPQGEIHQAVTFQDREPMQVLLRHEAQIRASQPSGPIAYRIVLPGKGGNGLQTALYRLEADVLHTVRGMSSHEVQLSPDGPKIFDAYRHSTAGLRIQLMPMKQQHALEIRDRRNNLLVSISAERVMDSPAQRLMALFELRRQAATDTMRDLAEREIEEVVAHVAGLSKDHEIRGTFLKEIGEDPRTVIAELLTLLNQGTLPASHRALIDEAIAHREIVGFSKLHQILSYEALEPKLPPPPRDLRDPPPSAVRFVESIPDSKPINRVMIRSLAASAADYTSTMREAVAQLRCQIELHPQSRENVIQLVVQRMSTLADDDVYSDFLRDNIHDAFVSDRDALRVNRITFIVHRPGGYPDYFTFEQEAMDAAGNRTGPFVEVRRIRHIHPMLAHFFELWRLGNFELEQDLAHSDRSIHLHYGKSKATPMLKAGQLFASALVPEAEVQRSSTGVLEGIPEVEASFVKLARAMQESLGGLEEAPIWNRMFLHIQPELNLSDQEVAAYAETLAVRHWDLLRGLGLEKVVVKGRLADSRAPHKYRTVLVRVSNPTGFQFEPTLHNLVRARVQEESGEVRSREVLIRNGVYEQWLEDPTRVIEFGDWAPADIPIRPATPTEIREQMARSKGAVWAYRIPALISQVAERFRLSVGLGRPRELGSEPPTENPYASSFVELDLDPKSTRIDPRTRMLDYNLGELIPATDAEGLPRPAGGNQAGVVVGIQTDNLGIGSPVRRVVILGDFTYVREVKRGGKTVREGMGSLSANECARINAAIRLAAREGIPVDWYPYSSGAEIHEQRGVENLDATASTAREIVLRAQSLGVPINVIVAGVNIGAQSYWDSLAAIIHNTGGILIMTPRGSMALTGPDALTGAFVGNIHSEDIPAQSKKMFPRNLQSLAGYEEIHGPNGEAMAVAPHLETATELLLRHHYYSYRPMGEGIVRLRGLGASDSNARDVTVFPTGKNHRTVGREIADILAGRSANREAILEALRDQGSPPFLRWWADAQGIRHQPGGNGLRPQRFGSMIGEMQIGGRPTMVIFPPIGPLTPADSEIIARSLWKANGRMPVLIIGSLTGFEADPRSMENRQLFGGASIAEAIVLHRGPITVVDMGYMVGGTFVVISKQLNPDLRILALEGAHAQVIGGASAAKVVFRSAIRREADADPRIVRPAQELKEAQKIYSRIRSAVARELNPLDVPEQRAQVDEDTRVVQAHQALQEKLAAWNQVWREVLSELETRWGRRFDEHHSVQRAVEVGALDEVIVPAQLRERVIFHQEQGLKDYRERAEQEQERIRAQIADRITEQDPMDQLRILRESLVRVYGEGGGREIARHLAAGLIHFADRAIDGEGGSGTPEGGVPPASGEAPP